MKQHYFYLYSGAIGEALLGIHIGRTLAANVPGARLEIASPRSNPFVQQLAAELPFVTYRELPKGRLSGWIALIGLMTHRYKSVALAPVTTRARGPKPKGYGLKLVLALFAVWVFWGSTFAAIHYAVATIPPFVMASTRFILAGAILWAACAVMGRARPARGDWVRAGVTGTTLLLLGNGVTSWCVQFVPTGLCSLLLSTSPIWMALIAFAWGGERPTRLAVVGMLLGFAGLALLLQPKATSGIPLWPALLAVLASLAWSFGSIYQRRAGRGGSLMPATALQMLVGGALLAIVAAFSGEWRELDVHAITTASLGGFAWLLIFGSLCAYGAYLYTMQSASTALAST